MSLVMTAGRPPCLPLRCGGVQTFQGGLADALAFGLGHRGEECEQHPARPAGVVDARQRAGEHLQDRAVRGQVVGQGGQLRGVTAEAFQS
jgi:hypothetical protein